MKIQIVDSHPPVTEADVTKIEKLLNASFPDDYRNFLMKHNGGQPKPQAFPLPNNPVDSHALLERLFCIGSGDMDDIVVNLDILRGRMPPEIIPIGDDPGGNLICISLSGTNRGKIYFWAHEEEYLDDRLPDYHNLYFVAENFSQLLDSLIDL